jgi:integrase
MAIVQSLAQDLRVYAPGSISIEDVDAFRRAKVREGLSPRSVNKLLSTLSAILELACEYGHVQRNVAHGKRRRIKAEPTQRSYINRADHLAALLAGASKVDANARLRPGQRRALLAVLAFAGLRHSEALALCWGDVNLAHGTISVRDGKTVTAARMVYIVPVLSDDLSSYKASVKPEPQELVFATATGRPLGASNVRRRILGPAIKYANKQLAKAKVQPLPDGLTPQSLRRTFASLLFAVGESPVYVKGQLGHTDATLTLNYYAKEMDRRDGEPERLKALVEGRVWTHLDSKAPEAATGTGDEDTLEPVKSGILPE